MTAVVFVIWALNGFAWALVIWREVADMRSTPTTKPGQSHAARHIKPGMGVSTGPRAPLPSMSNQFGSIRKGSRS